MQLNNTNKITIDDKDFFTLLQSGIWQLAVQPLSSQPDWDYIFRLATEQAIMPIIADGVAIVRAKYPDTAISDDQFNILLSSIPPVVQRNYKINQLLSRLCRSLEKENITFVVVKGQPVSFCYPHPNFRFPGDIDFLVDEENYRKAKNVLRSFTKSSCIEDLNQKHYEISIEGIPVELHADEFGATDLRLMRVYKRYKDQMLLDKEFDCYMYDGVKIPLPPITWHASYIFVHFYKHYISSGLGLRQIVDWCLFLQKYQDQIDYLLLQKYLQRFGFTKQWEMFLGFITDYLGFSPRNKKLLVVNQSKGVPKIWEQIKCTGDFGHNINTNKLNSNHTLVRKFCGTVSNEYEKYKIRRRVSEESAWRQIGIMIRLRIQGLFRKRKIGKDNI